MPELRWQGREQIDAGEQPLFLRQLLVRPRLGGAFSNWTWIG